MIDIPFTKYLEMPAISASALKAFAKCPALSQVAREETAALSLGQLVHCAILEPDALESRFLATDVDRRGTKAWAAAEEAAAGRELVKQADMETALYMRDSVWSNPTAAALLTGAHTEQSVFWNHAGTGQPCKARSDAVNLELRALIDVKTTVDASPREFARQFVRYGYGLQDVHYRQGFSADTFAPEAFVFLAVEKSPPYLVALYELTADQLAVYQERHDSLMDRYSECLKTGLFPGYDPMIQPLELQYF